MSKSTSGATDWDRLAADPDLLGNLGKLLQISRRPADRRDQALLAAMRNKHFQRFFNSIKGPAGAKNSRCCGTRHTRVWPDIFQLELARTRFILE